MLKRVAAVAAAASLFAVPGASIAGTVASAARVSAVSGNALIARNGAVRPAKVGESLQVGDRLITRGNSTVRVDMAGCSQTMGATSMATLKSSNCSGFVRGASLAQTGTGEYSDAGAASATGGYVVAGLAAVAVGLGIYLVVDEDDEPDDSDLSPSPVSPE